MLSSLATDLARFSAKFRSYLGRAYMLSGRAECDCRLIVFPEEAFWKLLRLCPAISGEIFRAMVTRLRSIEGSARQQEKLETLGTMSAGLAHD